MGSLARSTTEPTIRVLPLHNGIDRPKHREGHSLSTPIARKKTQVPLLVIGIDADLQRAQRLQRPKHKPRLARILARVACGKTLDEIAHKELEMRPFIQDASADTVEWDLSLEDVLGVGL
jgi:hypothetical protein